MKYAIGIDVGGTFTDAFLASAGDFVASAKSLSTPPNYEVGVLNCLQELARDMGVDLRELLEETAHISHGTTTTLNAMVTGDTATVGLITTRGHRDSIYIMNLTGRYAGLDYDKIQDFVRTSKPLPLIPKRRAREVTERIDFKGDVIVKLDEQEAHREIQVLLDEKVDAIAVSFLWSFKNTLHERRIREIVREMAPDVYVAISSEISPKIREYTRTATTIVNCQVGPVLRRYLNDLRDELPRRGYLGPLLIMQGSGGTIAAADAPEHAVTTLGSVLSGGVSGSMYLGRILGHKNIIATDVGGTTFLVGLVVNAEAVRTNTMVLNQYTINTPMVRVRSIGAGGGAIAWLDDIGRLRVGPKSAGAIPGPACYDQGGDRPTATDADLVRGVLNPEFFLGGRMRLRKDLASEAIRRHVAEPLGMSVEEAAAAITSIQNAQAADLARQTVVGAGFDPRDFVLYAFGGAGPVHCCAYGAELAVKEIVVPLGATASAFSAMGLAASSVILTREISEPGNYPLDPCEVNRVFRRLEGEVEEWLTVQGIALAKVSLRREVDIRYTLQVAEVATPVPPGELDARSLIGVVTEFEAQYERLFGKGAGFREAGLQFITYRVIGTGELRIKPHFPEVRRRSGKLDDAFLEKRRVFMDEAEGWQDAAVYDYRKLAAADEIPGPAIIEATSTTVAIPSRRVGRIDPYGNLVIGWRE